MAAVLIMLGVGLVLEVILALAVAVRPTRTVGQ
jgi:hypothetical protein